MDQQYKENINQIEQILDFLESNEHSLDVVDEKVNEGLIKIQDCLELLEKSESKIRVVGEISGRLTFKNFDYNLEVKEKWRN